MNGVGRSRNTSQVVGLCHSCGKFGHFRSSCPKLQPAANKSSESTCMYNIAAGNSCGALCDVHVTDGTVFDTSLPNVGDSSSEPFLFYPLPTTPNFITNISMTINSTRNGHFITIHFCLLF